MNDLITAIENEDLNRVAELVNSGVDLLDPRIYSTAVKVENLDILKILLSRANGIVHDDTITHANEENEPINYAIIQAAKLGKVSVLKWLVEEYNISVIDDDDVGIDVYNVADYYERFDIIDYLVSIGSDFYSNDNFNCDDAIEYPNIAKFCYDKHYEDDESKKEYLSSIACYGHLDILKYIIENNNISDDDINELYVVAAYCGELDVLKYLSTKTDVDNTLALRNIVTEEITNKYYMMDPPSDNYQVIKYLIEQENTDKDVIDLIIEEGLYKDDGEYKTINTEKSIRNLFKNIGECPVCFDTKKLVRIHDSHFMCQKCIDRMDNKLCPLCRSEFNDDDIGLDPWTFGKKYSKRTLKKRSKKHLKKRSKKHLKKRSKKHLKKRSKSI